jgi:uncharacterized protein (TIGR03437 family)
VLFNGSPAPLVYARTDQVAAVVPNAVAGKSGVSLSVEYQGQTTPAMQLPVAATAPGLFTVNGTGNGQGAILNQDASVNSTANPAARGSIISMFGTGQGQSDPDWSEDALATAPLPQPVNVVKVTIGGQPAEVLYAGAAPGLAAVFQVNARVPLGIKPGVKIAVVVAIGEANSQPGVTLAVQ